MHRQLRFNLVFGIASNARSEIAWLESTRSRKRSQEDEIDLGQDATPSPRHEPVYVLGVTDKIELI